MKLTLIREKFYDECTHGHIYIDGAFYCDTFEPLRSLIAWTYAKREDIFIEIK